MEGGNDESRRMIGGTYTVPPPMHVAVVDIGTNSTRLLVADVGRRWSRSPRASRP